jgi:hypothetical protein
MNVQVEAARSSKTLVSTYKSKQRRNSERKNRHNIFCCEFSDVQILYCPKIVMSVDMDIISLDLSPGFVSDTNLAVTRTSEVRRP